MNLYTNPSLQHLVPVVYRILSISNVLESRNLSELTVTLSQYDILLFADTLVLDMHNVSELLVPGFGRPVLLCGTGRLVARWMKVYVRDGSGAF